MFKKRSVAALIASLLACTISYASDIPVAPVSALKDGVPKPITHINKSVSNKNSEPDSSLLGMINNANVIQMVRGVNQIIPIAYGHPNRIVTPFTNPDVTTTTLNTGNGDGCGEVCVKGNVIYIATENTKASSIFITEKGEENTALSLTLVPLKIPPREVFLKFDSSSQIAFAGISNKNAQKWERSQPYIETIRSLFRTLALNDVPQGYSMGSVNQSMFRDLPGCEQEGMQFNFVNGQYFTGHSLNVFVGTAKNTSNELIEFKEVGCGNWDVAAVTSWPHKLLEPGQVTEIYVAKKRSVSKPVENKRPSLIAGGK